MLKKRGKKYYAVFSFDRREKWINTEKTDRKEALKVHARLESLFERERITRTLTGALLNCVKSLARQEITADAAKKRPRKPLTGLLVQGSESPSLRHFYAKNSDPIRNFIFEF